MLKIFSITLNSSFTLYIHSLRKFYWPSFRRQSAASGCSHHLQSYNLFRQPSFSPGHHMSFYHGLPQSILGMTVRSILLKFVLCCHSSAQRHAWLPTTLCVKTNILSVTFETTFGPAPLPVQPAFLQPLPHSLLQPHWPPCLLRNEKAGVHTVIFVLPAPST